MDTSYNFDSSPRTYLLSSWRRALYILLGAFLLGAGLVTGGLAAPMRGSIPGGMLALFLAGAGIYTIAYGWRSRITLAGSRITVQGAFNTKSADRSEIEGQRTYSDRNGTYTQLWLSDGRGKITFQRGFETDGDFDAWMRPVQDLDQKDRDAILDKIAHDQAFGSTPEERRSALRYSIAWAVLTHAVALLGGIALNLGDESLQAGAALLVALAPIGAIYLAFRSPLLYALFRSKKDPRSELGFVLMISGFSLFIRCREIHMLSNQNVLAAAGFIAVASAAVAFNTMRQGANMLGRMIVLLFAMGMYGYGLTVVSDALFDHSTPAYYATSILGTHVSHGKSTTYYLDLAPWGPIPGPNRISVSSTEYYHVSVGDPVCFNLRPGSLHLAWYGRTECTGAPSSAP